MADVAVGGWEHSRLGVGLWGPYGGWIRCFAASDRQALSWWYNLATGCMRGCIGFVNIPACDCVPAIDYFAGVFAHARKDQHWTPTSASSSATMVDLRRHPACPGLPLTLIMYSVLRRQSGWLGSGRTAADDGDRQLMSNCTVDLDFQSGGRRRSGHWGRTPDRPLEWRTRTRPLSATIKRIFPEPAHLRTVCPLLLPCDVANLNYRDTNGASGAGQRVRRGLYIVGIDSMGVPTSCVPGALAGEPGDRSDHGEARPGLLTKLATNWQQAGRNLQ